MKELISLEFLFLQEKERKGNYVKRKKNEEIMKKGKK